MTPADIAFANMHHAQGNNVLLFEEMVDVIEGRSVPDPRLHPVYDWKVRCGVKSVPGLDESPSPSSSTTLTAQSDPDGTVSPISRICAPLPRAKPIVARSVSEETIVVRQPQSGKVKKTKKQRASTASALRRKHKEFVGRRDVPIVPTRCPSAPSGRRDHRTPEQRVKDLEEDPAIEEGSVQRESVVCKGCSEPVKLDTKTAYQDANWLKHRDGPASSISSDHGCVCQATCVCERECICAWDVCRCETPAPGVKSRYKKVRVGGCLKAQILRKNAGLSGERRNYEGIEVASSA